MNKTTEEEKTEQEREEAARWRKAAKLLAVVAAGKMDLETLAGYGPAQWKLIATAARVHPPSDATILQVLHLLDEAREVL